ncbi:MAG: hypothetical protein KQI81_09220 [Deltaproteobacteria bacterium]|nr:hypothetical protein [Deltaproteobacteria bacterium]
MDSPLMIAAAASFIAGLLGYIIARLWIKPIARYTITKRRLDHELTQYLALMNATGEPDKKRERQKRGEAMLKTARKHSMDLVSCYGADIPYWYRLLLDSRKESPTEASGLLTNLSKIRDREQVRNRINHVRKISGLK